MRLTRTRKLVRADKGYAAYSHSQARASALNRHMSVLRTIESKIAGLVEGTFSRAFKSEVRPVEIARKLTREMEENKVQSLSRTYAPNEYAVWLSSDDRKQFEGYERDLATELSGYLLEHARRERIAL